MHPRQDWLSACSSNFMGGMRTEELLEGAEPGLPEPIWKLTPVGRVPVCPLAVMTLYAVTCARIHLSVSAAESCTGVVT